MFNRFQKLCQIFSLTILFAPIMSVTAGEEGEDYYHFPTGDHEGGGVRGTLTSCATNANYPVPLVPEDAKTLTASPSPILFFEVPDAAQASTLELVLLDGDNQVIYQNELPTSDRSGIVGLNLFDETNSKALQVNNSYHWYLIQQCGAEPNIVANGSLQRVELDNKLTKKINNAFGLEKVKLYQQANIWHEAIADLANLKCNLKANSRFQQAIDEAFTNISNLSSQDFQSYCLNNSKSDPLVMQ